MSFKLGEEIVRCKPFAYVVSKEHQRTLCDFCLRSSDSLSRCSGCKYIYYCDRKCQIPAWKSHRDECKYFKSVAPKIPGDTVRLLARIIIKLRSGGGKETDKLPDGSLRRFDDLISHAKEIVRDEMRKEAFTSYFSVLCDCFQNDIPQACEVLEIYGKVLINSFNIMDNEYQPIGIGLYLGASVFDHSCSPNATVIFHNKEISIRCIDKNGIKNFSQVRISYINLLNETAQRRKDTLEQYYFKCKCLTCTEDPQGLDPLKTSSMKCPQCGQRLEITEANSGNCVSCSQVVPSIEVKRFLDLKMEVRQKVFENKGLHPCPDELYEEYYKKMDALCHPYDRLYIHFLEKLSQLRLENKNYKGAYTVGEKLLVAYRKYYPKYDVNTGLLLIKSGKLALLLNLLKRAEKMLSESESVLLITHGKDHLLYNKILKDLKDLFANLRLGKRETKEQRRINEGLLLSIKNQSG